MHSGDPVNLLSFNGPQLGRLVFWSIFAVRKCMGGGELPLGWAYRTGARAAFDIGKRIAWQSFLGLFLGRMIQGMGPVPESWVIPHPVPKGRGQEGICCWLFEFMGGPGPPLIPRQKRYGKKFGDVGKNFGRNFF